MPTPGSHRSVAALALSRSSHSHGTWTLYSVVKVPEGIPLTYSQWEQVKEYSKRGVKKHSSRCLPFEGRNFQKTGGQNGKKFTKVSEGHFQNWKNFLNSKKNRKCLNFTAFSWSTTWGDFSNPLKKVSRREYVKKLWIFRKTPPKTVSPSRNK